MEGLSHEACSLAGHLRLRKLVVLFDDNGISIDGSTSLSCSDDTLMRFRSYGWHAEAIDGHDPEAIDAAMQNARDADRPVLLACKTIIAKGAPTKAGTAASHGSPLGAAEIEGARRSMRWVHPPFHVPEAIRARWLAAGARCRDLRSAWEARYASASTRGELQRRLDGRLPDQFERTVTELVDQLLAARPSWATRKASQEVLTHLTQHLPELLGGSADLTGSNLTNTPSTPPLKPGGFGRHLHYGVREHGMVAAMNGMALHGGYIPYGGTFLVFTDYCRPALRLAALMRQRIVLVGTHDSIGLGEDGPTHQPVEHLASLRAIPDMMVFRPADVIETAECWAVALRRRDGPAILALSRQEVPCLRDLRVDQNLSALGGYVLDEAPSARDATILATGTEVAIAVQARRLLEEDGFAVAVVSLPCFELFEAQSQDYRDAVLGTAPRVAVEAASPWGWTRYVERECDVVGMRSFGASAPQKALYEHFGITAEAVAGKVRDKLGEAARVKGIGA